MLADNDYVPASPNVPAKVADLKPDCRELQGQYGHARYGARRPAEMDRHLQGVVPVTWLLVCAAMGLLLPTSAHAAEVDAGLVDAARKKAQSSGTAA